MFSTGFCICEQENWLSLLLGDSRYIGKKPVKHCLNARAKMTSDKFDDQRLLARKTNENKMKNG